MPTFHRRKIRSKKKKGNNFGRANLSLDKKKEGKRGEGMKWIISRGYYAFFNAVRVSIWRGEKREFNWRDLFPRRIRDSSRLQTRV